MQQHWVVVQGTNWLLSKRLAPHWMVIWTQQQSSSTSFLLIDLPVYPVAFEPCCVPSLISVPVSPTSWFSTSFPPPEQICGAVQHYHRLKLADCYCATARAVQQGSRVPIQTSALKMTKEIPAWGFGKLYRFHIGQNKSQNRTSYFMSVERHAQSLTLSKKSVEPCVGWLQVPCKKSEPCSIYWVGIETPSSSVANCASKHFFFSG